MSEQSEKDKALENFNESIDVQCHCDIERVQCDKCKFCLADVNDPLNTLGLNLKPYVKSEWDSQTKKFVASISTKKNKEEQPRIKKEESVLEEKSNKVTRSGRQIKKPGKFDL